MSAEVEAHLAAGLDRYVAELCDFCAIPSISAQPAHKADVERAARFVGRPPGPRRPRGRGGPPRLASFRTGLVAWARVLEALART